MIKDFKSFVFVSVDVKGVTDANFVSVDVKGLTQKGWKSTVESREREANGEGIWEGMGVKGRRQSSVLSFQ